METEYTKGFRAGLAYEQERIINLLANWAREEIWIETAIELINGEKNG